MIFKILLICMLIIGIFMYLLILGANKSKTQTEREMENEEQIEILKSYKYRRRKVKKKIRRNEIYLANLGNTIGSEERGKRPVLIVQNDLGNRYSSTTIVIPIIKRVEEKNHIPTHIKIKLFGKMKYEATIMAEQIKIIDKKRLIKFIDKLP